MQIATIDFETLGLGTNAPLLSLGLVVGDTAKDNIVYEQELVIPWSFNRSTGRAVELETIVWWLDKIKEKDALAVYFRSMLKKSLKTSSACLSKHLGYIQHMLEEFPIEGIFCTDKSFDWVFMQQLCSHYSVRLPISYKHVYETRYMQEHSHKEIFSQAKEGTLSHSAIGDARWLFNALQHIV